MLSKFAIGLAIAALACLIGGPLLAQVAVVPPMAGMAIFAISALLGLGGMIAGGLAALVRQAYIPAMVGMLGCLPLIAVGAGAANAIRYPAINDITTATADPPAFVHAPTLPQNTGRDFAFPEPNAPLIAEYYPDMRPLAVPRPPRQVYQLARDVATSGAFDWTITAEDEHAHTFEAIATTRLFQWKDDVVVRIRPDGEGGSIVDLRSKSREGKGDLGANARRIRDFMKALATN